MEYCCNENYRLLKADKRTGLELISDTEIEAYLVNSTAYYNLEIQQGRFERASDWVSRVQTRWVSALTDLSDRHCLARFRYGHGSIPVSAMMDIITQPAGTAHAEYGEILPSTVKALKACLSVFLPISVQELRRWPETPYAVQAETDMARAVSLGLAKELITLELMPNAETPLSEAELLTPPEAELLPLERWSAAYTTIRPYTPTALSVNSVGISSTATTASVLSTTTGTIVSAPVYATSFANIPETPSAALMAVVDAMAETAARIETATLQPTQIANHD